MQDLFYDTTSQHLPRSHYCTPMSHDSTVDTYFLSTRQSVTQAVMMDPTAELRAGLALQPGLRLPQPESYAATLADRSLPV